MDLASDVARVAFGLVVARAGFAVSRRRDGFAAAGPPAVVAGVPRVVAGAHFPYGVVASAALDGDCRLDGGGDVIAG